MKLKEKKQLEIEFCSESSKDRRTAKQIAEILHITETIEIAGNTINQYNEELSLELADLDIEYDTMKCMYDTLLEQMRAKKESEKTATSTAAQDTGLLNAG